MTQLTREQAVALLKEYNHEPFHLRHAFTVEAVMDWYARELGYGDQAEFWAMAGLLHDLDFEQYPEEHCVKVREIMEGSGVSQVQGAILAAVNIADEYFKEVEASENLRRQLKEYLEEATKLKMELSEAKREIFKLQNKKQ